MKGKNVTTIVVAVASTIGFVVALVRKCKKKVSSIGSSAGKTC